MEESNNGFPAETTLGTTVRIVEKQFHDALEIFVDDCGALWTRMGQVGSHAAHLLHPLATAAEATVEDVQDGNYTEIPGDLKADEDEAKKAWDAEGDLVKGEFGSSETASEPSDPDADSNETLANSVDEPVTTTEDDEQLPPAA